MFFKKKETVTVKEAPYQRVEHIRVTREDWNEAEWLRLHNPTHIQSCFPLSVALKNRYDMREATVYGAWYPPDRRFYIVITLEGDGCYTTLWAVEGGDDLCADFEHGKQYSETDNIDGIVRLRELPPGDMPSTFHFLSTLPSDYDLDPHSFYSARRHQETLGGSDALDAFDREWSYLTIRFPSIPDEK